MSTMMNAEHSYKTVINGYEQSFTIFRVKLTDGTSRTVSFTGGFKALAVSEVMECFALDFPLLADKVAGVSEKLKANMRQIAFGVIVNS